MFCLIEERREDREEKRRGKEGRGEGGRKGRLGCCSREGERGNFSGRLVDRHRRNA